MALKSSIYKARLNVSDMDRHVYQEFALRVACHPSETQARLMLRLLAFALHAGEGLEFGRGISTDNEPDLWQKDLTDNIQLWVDLGLPDESRIRKACGRAEQVVLLAYGDRAAAVWWPKYQAALERFKNLRVIQIADESMESLAQLASMSMGLQCMIQDGVVNVSSDDSDQLVELSLIELKP